MGRVEGSTIAGVARRLMSGLADTFHTAKLPSRAQRGVTVTFLNTHRADWRSTGAFSSRQPSGFLGARPRLFLAVQTRPRIASRPNVFRSNGYQVARGSAFFTSCHAPSPP